MKFVNPQVEVDKIIKLSLAVAKWGKDHRTENRRFRNENLLVEKLRA